LNIATKRSKLILIYLNTKQKERGKRKMDVLRKQSQLLKLYQESLQGPSKIIQFANNKSIVFGEGNPDADLMLIGEAPGKNEDEQGRPFVGRSGTLLNKLLEIASICRSDTYITNIVKSRPPNNRKPTAQEIEHGRLLLVNQINIIRPKIICTLGSSSLQALLGRNVQIARERGKVTEFNGTRLLPTYHPAYVLRNQKELSTLAQDIITASKHIKRA